MLTRRFKRVTLGLAFGFLALALFITLLNRHFAALELRQRLEEERAEIREPVPLVHTVERDTVTRTRTFSARLHPWNDARVAAEVAGRVEAVLVEPGDPVARGDVLVRLDDTLAELQATAADAAVAAARAQFDEFVRQAEEAERLTESRAAPESRLQEARSRVAVQEREIERLQAEAARARETHRRHDVVAPFNGAAAEKLVEPGDAVTAYQPVYRIAALDPMRVVFFAGEDEAARLAAGSGAALRLPGAAETHRLEISHLAPVADHRTGTVRVEARLPNPGHTFRGGRTGTVEAAIAVYEDHPFVPATAVRYEGRQAFVDRLPDGDRTSAESVAVELGPEIRGRYPVLSGLNAGDSIVIR